MVALSPALLYTTNDTMNVVPTAVEFEVSMPHEETSFSQMWCPEQPVDIQFGGGHMSTCIQEK